MVTSLYPLPLWIVFAFLLSAAPAKSPRVRTITFLLCNRCIYCVKLGQYWTSLSMASSSASFQPSMQFLFVGSGFCLRLPSDSTSRWTPLPLANSSFCLACSGLSPPSYRPCRAHNNKPHASIEAWGLLSSILPRNVVHSAAQSDCYESNREIISPCSDRRQPG